MNGLQISLETFKNLKDTDAKLDALFEGLEHFCVAANDREKRIQQLEGRKVKNTVVAGGGGVMGGLLLKLGDFLISKL